MRNISGEISQSLDRTGQYLFNRRNVLFPVVLGVLIMVCQPRRLDDRVGDVLLALGFGLLTLGQTLRIVTIGLDYIKRGGKGGRIYANRLVTGGIYRHTRNPMYAGNLLIVFGWLLVAGNPVGLAIGGAFFYLAYYLIMRSEERYLSNTFGDAYATYCARVPRWLPRLPGFATTIRSYQFDWPAVIVKEYGTIFSTFMITTGIVAYKAMLSNEFDRHWPWYAVAAALWIALYVMARYLKKGVELKPRGVTLVKGAIEVERRRLDVIDTSILELLNERAIHVDAIFEIKKNSGMPRFDATRTRQIIDRIKNLNQGPLADDDVESIFAFVLHHFAFEYSKQRSDTSFEVATVPEVSVFVSAGELV